MLEQHMKVQVSMDSIEVINMIMRGCSQSHPFRNIMDDARLLLAWDW